MSFERFIAFKHLMHRRKTGFISFISMISVLGVGVGVMALIVVLAVMSGFDKELKAKIVNVQPHLRIEKFGGISSPEGVIDHIKSNGIAELKSISGYIEGQAIVRSRFGAQGVIVKGVDAANEDLAIYQKQLIRGNLDFSTTIMSVPEERKFLFFKRKPEWVEKAVGSVVLGEPLAARLRVQEGDLIDLISPFQEESNSLSVGSAEVGTFVVKGLFRIGMNDFDSSLVLTSLDEAQRLYHLGDRVSGISMRFINVDEAELWKTRLRRELPGYHIRSWYDLNANFFQALKVEKTVMTILLALIVLVATFNIVSTLTMVVMEKTKDIGILRAIGATRASIRKIFVIQGFSVGIFGVMMGTVAGLALAFHLNEVSDFLKKYFGIEVFPSDIYYFDKIPAEIIPQDVVIVVGFAIVASILAGLYPSHKASTLNPIEALRYE